MFVLLEHGTRHKDSHMYISVDYFVCLFIVVLFRFLWVFFVFVFCVFAVVVCKPESY